MVERLISGVTTSTTDKIVEEFIELDAKSFEPFVLYI